MWLRQLALLVLSLVVLNPNAKQVLYSWMQGGTVVAVSAGEAELVVCARGNPPRYNQAVGSIRQIL